jgi:hypothetical protein
MTSPRAMVGTMQKVVLGDALSRRSRNLLQQCCSAIRLKTGLPKD